jgi:hypothetical protein
MVRAIVLVMLGSLLASSAFAGGKGSGPQPVDPVFLAFKTADASDYRPVLNATGAVVVFERTFAASPNVTKLYSAQVSGGAASPFATIASTRPDWCWLRSGKSPPSIGPVAFSNDNGIYTVNGDGSELSLLPNTAGMVYPSWYPDCAHLAVDVAAEQQHITAEIDAKTGKTIADPLANDQVWAGFPSVNQVNPNLVAFAGQFNKGSNYYDEDLNYTWVTDRSRKPPRVFPMDRDAPKGTGFLQKFQARAGWWSPDGRWFAFESNRICDEIDGATYAIFIQDSAGEKPAMQVSSCDWNTQHPKWFPPGPGGVSTMLIAAVASPGQNQPFAIATFDVTEFVTAKH